MVLDLITEKTGDGYNAEVPSISGCESWAHEEHTAINNAVELLKFYLNVPAEKKIKIDRARNFKNQIIYKIIFDK